MMKDSVLLWLCDIAAWVMDRLILLFSILPKEWIELQHEIYELDLKISRCRLVLDLALEYPRLYSRRMILAWHLQELVRKRHMKKAEQNEIEHQQWWSQP